MQVKPDGFVLVAGSGPWVWEKVIPRLRLPALALEMPGRGAKVGDLRHLTVSSWVESCVKDIQAIGFSRIALVGHSAGGLAATGIACRIPKLVEHLVLVSACVPAEGGTLASTMKFPPSVVPLFFFAALGRKPPFWTWRLANGHDMDTATLRDFADRLSREMTQRAGSQFAREPISRADLPTSIPRTYVKLLRDKGNLPPAQQDRMIANLGGARVMSFDSGHYPMFSCPAEFASFLNAFL